MSQQPYNNESHILHLEFQAASDEEMPQRLLTYHSSLLLNYQQPVISMVIYLFRTRTPKPPLKEVSGSREILTFYYQVVELWMLDARHHLQEHTMSMYSLLPAMQNADAVVLLQAVEELVEYYKDSEAKLARRLLWFSTFLKRADTVSPQDRQKVEERLDVFEKLLEENDFVRKQRALGVAQGKEQGKLEGRIDGEVDASRHILLDILQARYPALAESVKLRIAQTRQVERLREAIRLIVNISDEQTAKYMLNTVLA